MLKRTGIVFININEISDNWFISEFVISIKKKQNTINYHKFIKTKNIKPYFYKKTFIKHQDNFLFDNKYVDETFILNDLFSKIFLIDSNDIKAPHFIFYTNDLKAFSIKFIFWNNKKLRYKIFSLNEKIYYLKVFVGDGKFILIKNIFMFFPFLENSKEYSSFKILNMKNNLFYKIEEGLGSKEEIVKLISYWFSLLEYLNSFTIKFISTWNEHKFSSATLSKFFFLRKFNNSKIRYSFDLDIDKQLRLGYFGGRAEIFKNPIIDEQVAYFDFPSMYPTIMKEDFYTNFELELQLNPTDHTTPGIYHTKVLSSSENYFPPLPSRLEVISNETSFSTTIYANGILEGWYTNEMLNYFLSLSPNNKIITYNKAYVFKNYKIEKPFLSYINFFLNLKNTTDGDKKLLWKLILNSLTGTLGFKVSNTETLLLNSEDYKKWMKTNLESIHSIKSFTNYYENPAILITTVTKNDTHPPSHFFFKNHSDLFNENRKEELIYLIQYEKKMKNSFINSNLIYPIFINSKAQIKLHKNILNLHNNGIKVLAVNTDSIFISFPHNLKNKILNKQFKDVFFDENNELTLPKSAIFINTTTYSIKYENSDLDVTSFYNNPTSEFTYEDYLQTSFQDFNKKFLTIKGNVEINSYNKRIWKNINRNSDPLFFKNNY